MVMALVVMVVLVPLLGRILVSFLILILRMVLMLERGLDVVFCDSIFGSLPPISAGIQVWKIGHKTGCHMKLCQSYQYVLK